MKWYAAFCALFLLGAVCAPSVEAQSGGGGLILGITTADSNHLAVDKTIYDDRSRQYVQNLDQASLFTPGAIIRYRITVANTGTIPAHTITIKDILPPYLTLTSAPGTVNDGVVMVTVDALAPGKTTTIDLVASVNTDIPRTTRCFVNRAEVTSATGGPQVDIVQSCVAPDEGTVLGTSTLPDTGSYELIVAGALGTLGILSLLGSRSLENTAH